MSVQNILIELLCSVVILPPTFLTSFKCHFWWAEVFTYSLLGEVLFDIKLHIIVTHELL